MIKKDENLNKNEHQNSNLEQQTNETAQKSQDVENQNENKQENQIKTEQTNEQFDASQNTDNQPNTEQSNQQECEKSFEKEYEELLSKYNDLNDRYLRLNADFDNFRKRTLKEKMDLIKSGGADILAGLLKSIDDIERGMKYINEGNDLEAIKEGINIIYSSLREFLKQKGVVEIEALNQPFNTEYHEAVTTIPAPNEEMKGKVVDVIQKGYLYNDKILRIAKVVVAQ